MTAFRSTLAALACALFVSGCASSTPSATGNGRNDVSLRDAQRTGAASCGSLFDRIIGRERSGDTSGAINAELDALGDQCPSEYRVFVDYASIKGSAEIGAGGRCSDYYTYGVEPAAIQLARRDGFCSGSGVGSDSPDGGQWTCRYQPTYNEDWHDDVLCSNGIEQQRPSLRSWDSFVTEAEIMESAREYEQQLNGE